jgi:NADH-quinone oxidoreductase subunit N
MPFHTWMIDVYEQAPLGLVMFFDTFWKLFMVIIFAKVFKVLEYGQVNAVLEIFAISSMLIGSIMAIFQNNIKRFIAYTSVGHIGFIMTVFIISSQIVHAITYALSYAFASVCFFISLQSLKRRIETFDDLAGTMNENPITGIGLIISMFAMIGMPPFINFTAKLQILKLQIETQYYTILAISIIYSILCILYATKTMKVFNK